MIEAAANGIQESMKVIPTAKYGSPDLLQVKELEKSDPKANEEYLIISS